MQKSPHGDDQIESTSGIPVTEAMQKMQNIADRLLKATPSLVKRNKLLFYNFW